MLQDRSASKTFEYWNIHAITRQTAKMAYHHLICCQGMGCYTLGVLKLCYSVEMRENSSKFQGNTKVIPTQPTAHLDNAKLQGDSFLHCQNEGSVTEKLSNSTKQSFTKDQPQGMPLMKQDILEVYSDVFTIIAKFPSDPYKFQLKPNVKPARHALRHVPIHLQEAFH